MTTRVTYGTTADGLLAAKVGNIIYCMADRGSGFYITMRDVTKPVDISTLTRNSFFGHLGSVQNEEEFRSEMEDIATHLEEVKAFSRKNIPSSTSTPWGKSQGASVYVEKGIYLHTTARHGGMKVYAKLNRQIPEPYRNEDGWYEEDCEFSKVIVSLPQYFSQREIRQATETVINFYPDEYEKVTGNKVLPGQSTERDRQIFLQKHGNDLIAISALGFDTETGEKMVEVIASVGGVRSRYENNQLIEVETRTFIVPEEEYSQNRRPFGFVIDETRHQEKLPPATQEFPEASEEELNHLFGLNR